MQVNDKLVKEEVYNSGETYMTVESSNTKVLRWFGLKHLDNQTEKTNNHHHSASTALHSQFLNGSPNLEPVKWGLKCSVIV